MLYYNYNALKAKGKRILALGPVAEFRSHGRKDYKVGRQDFGAHLTAMDAEACLIIWGYRAGYIVAGGTQPTSAFS